MKKIIAIVLALVMVFALAACGETQTTETTETTEATETTETAAYETITPGVLTVATSPDFAPYEFYAIDENGNPQLSGFDMALAQYIADYLGLELEVVPMDFDGVLAELSTGNVDLGLAGLSPDPERADAMDFSDIYYLGGQSFVTTKGNEDKFPSLEAANNSEYAIGAQTGSIQFNLAQEYTPDADVIALTKVTDIVQELISGKLDGAFIETAVAECYAITYPELAVVLDVPYDAEGSAIGLPKGSTLTDAVNEAIAAAIADGSMDQFVADANELAAGNIYEGLLDAQ